MSELIQLIRADGLHADNRLDKGKISLGSGKNRHAGTGEGNLGGRSKIENPVNCALFFRFRKNVAQLFLDPVVKMVDCIGIVPENPEIGCGGFHRCQADYRFVRIRNTVRV